jgi:enoyl-CoA hydratase/carnithine racemase
MSDDLIQLTLGKVATLTLNRPDKLNALSPEMLVELEAAIQHIDRGSDDVRVVILTAAGERAFCVGADINAWGALEPVDMWRRWIRDGHRIFNALAGLRQPVIAALNGYTFGGGLELALAADIRLAADHVQLAMPEVSIGTIPGWGGTFRLPALIGVGRAKQMIFSAERVDAVTAERWGLLNEILPAADLMTRAGALAERIAENAPLSVQIAKQVMDGSINDNGMALESLAGALAATTQDAREGLAAFQERRSAQYRGT